jgi:phospholipase/carboxylesterase
MKVKLKRKRKKYMSKLNEGLALKYLVREPKTETAEKPLFIFLHGVGSNEKNLFTLADHLPDNFTVISARSPYTMGPDSFAFYQVDFSSGSPVINAEQAEKSRNVIKEFISQVVEKYNIDPDKVYLGGFSQGAIMTYSVGLTFPGLVKGIAGFSGRILTEIRPMVKEPEKLKVFISHGTSDNVLPVHFAREAKEYLSSLGIKSDYHEFYGSHEINDNILTELNNWIENNN